MSLSDLWAWCKRHLLLVTFLAVGLIFVFAVVNVQILHMTSEPEFCAMCHPNQGYGPLAEVDSWAHSTHAAAGVSCLDCHGRPGLVGYMKAKIGGLYDVYMQFALSPEEKLAILANPSPDLVPEDHCLYCHSDEQNLATRQATRFMDIVNMRMLDGVQNPEFRERKGIPDILAGPTRENSRFDHVFHMDAFNLSCNDCHFGVVHNPQSKTDLMNMCIACHQGYEGSSAPLLADCAGCHSVQNDMYLGQGARSVPEEEGLKSMFGISCEMCHSSVFQGIYRPSASTCIDCHDAGYNEILVMWQQDTKEQVAKLDRLRLTVEDALRDGDARGRDNTARWETFQKAVFNLKLVKKDGAKGAHNADYAHSILTSVEEDFNAILTDIRITW